MTDCCVCPYTLHSGAALNSASERKAFPGALLKVGHGYAALHPWPEFGDAPLLHHLRALAEGGSTALLERALHCVQLDGAARLAQRSLFADLTVPPSHYSWSMAQAVETQLQHMQRHGFTAVKVKGQLQHAQTLHLLTQLHSAIPSLRLRIDFNACLSAEEFFSFMTSLPPSVRQALDFIEDPFPYEAAAWQQARQHWGCRLALDKSWREGTAGFDTVVVKPARRDWRSVAARHPHTPLLLTSAMDHPLGQSYAAYEAALAQLHYGSALELTGLCTQHLFSPDAFSAKLGVAAATLQVDRSGTGLGFDAELQALPWVKLQDFLLI